MGSRGDPRTARWPGWREMWAKAGWWQRWSQTETRIESGYLYIYIFEQGDGVITMGGRLVGTYICMPFIARINILLLLYIGIII